MRSDKTPKLSLDIFWEWFRRSARCLPKILFLFLVKVSNKFWSPCCPGEYFIISKEIAAGISTNVTDSSVAQSQPMLNFRLTPCTFLFRFTHVVCRALVHAGNYPAPHSVHEPVPDYGGDSQFQPSPYQARASSTSTTYSNDGKGNGGGAPRTSG